MGESQFPDGNAAHHGSRLGYGPTTASPDEFFRHESPHRRTALDDDRENHQRFGSRQEASAGRHLSADLVYKFASPKNPLVCGPLLPAPPQPEDLFPPTDAAYEATPLEVGPASLARPSSRKVTVSASCDTRAGTELPKHLVHCLPRSAD